MHWIQRHILMVLSVRATARYTELIPEGVDGNLFTYHLKQLVNAKIIAKSEEQYLLTSKGKRDVATMSLKSGGEFKFPRVFAMIYVENKMGQICLYKWNRQPYLGHVSLPFNRVVYGSSIKETAEETLKFKTGLTEKISFIGTASVIVRNSKETTTHYVAHIYKSQTDSLDIEADGLTGKPFWDNISDFTGNELVYGTTEIVEIIKTKKSPFFEEILIQK